jgi:hypothetical protein
VNVPTTIDATAWLGKYLEGADGDSDLVRAMLGAFAEALMSAQASMQCGAAYGERSEERENSRHGYRLRPWDTRAGTIELAIPKLRRGTYSPEFLLQPRRRAEQALVAVICQAYVEGVSTRRVDDLVKAMGIDGISKSEVSRLAKEHLLSSTRRPTARVAVGTGIVCGRAHHGSFPAAAPVIRRCQPVLGGISLVSESEDHHFDVVSTGRDRTTSGGPTLVHRWPHAPVAPNAPTSRTIEPAARPSRGPGGRLTHSAESRRARPQKRRRAAQEAGWLPTATRGETYHQPWISSRRPALGETREWFGRKGLDG